MIAEPTPRDGLKDLARQFLELQQQRQERTRHHRAYFAKLAKTYGLTNQEIGEAYGITEAAVRGLIKRSVE